jgi:DNA repair exonuclease SbcCD nuclease subunit
MKILHTADLHLKKGEEQRLEIFTWLIQKAEELAVDYVVIAGDMFDSDTDATILRPQIKKILRAAPLTFLIIPGNHDATSFSKEYDYGNNVIQLVEKPFEIVERDRLTLCGIPYQDRRFNECIKNLPRDIDVVIAHGTLYDESFIYTMLDDEETRYMPMYPPHLENIARYVALGHLHARSIEKRYKNTHVVYPGSPIALDTKCVGERHFYLLSIDKKGLSLKPYRVEVSPFWTKKEFFVFPGIEQNIVNDIESYLNEIDNQQCMPYIIIKGFIAEKDRVFNNSIETIQTSCHEKFVDMRIEIEVQSWDKIIQNSMVNNFVEKTKKYDDSVRLKIFELTFPIFSKVLT